MAITNDAKSPLANVADYIIPLDAGEEKAVAATKTYSASLAALALFQRSSRRIKIDMQELTRSSRKIIGNIEKSLEKIDQTNRYRYMEHCVVLGRGFNYSTAFEVALKIKELTRVITAPYSSADFKHGPIATVIQGFPIIVIAPSGKMFDHIILSRKIWLNLVQN